MDLTVKRGAVGTTGMVHFVVPPRRFWGYVAFAAVVIGGVDALSGPPSLFRDMCQSHASDGGDAWRQRGRRFYRVPSRRCRKWHSGSQTR
jgi:hypothetical protein